MRMRHLLLVALLPFGCAAPRGPVGSPTPEDLSRLRVRAARDPSIESQVAYGAALGSAGNRDSARAVLERLVAAHPRSAAALAFLGITAEEQGDFARAGEAYRAYLGVGRSGALKDAIRRRLPYVDRQALVASARLALSREAQLATTPPVPRTVGVFPFLYAGRDSAYEPLSRALSALLTTDLGQTDRLRVLERTRVQTLLDEAKLSGSGLVDPKTAVRSGRLLRASRIVHGQIGGGQDALRISAGVVAPAGDLTAKPLQVQDPVARLFDMEKRLAFDLYQAMGIQLTAAERERISQRQTENLQALLEFGWGLESEDAGRYAEAARHYRRAASLDPKFVQAAQGAQRADELALQQVATAELRREAPREMFRVPSPSLLGSGVRPEPVPVVGLDEVRALLPDPLLRDPGAEFFGLDVVAAPATLVIILHR